MLVRCISHSTDGASELGWKQLPVIQRRKQAFGVTLGATEVNIPKDNMKLIKTLVVAMFALSLIAAPAFAESCCEKAKAAGKDCEHKCCAQAKKDGKTCEKCNPKKEEKK